MVFLVYSCEAREGPVVLNEEFESYAWVAPAKLPAFVRDAFTLPGGRSRAGPSRKRPETRGRSRPSPNQRGNAAHPRLGPRAAGGWERGSSLRAPRRRVAPGSPPWCGMPRLAASRVSHTPVRRSKRRLRVDSLLLLQESGSEPCGPVPLDLGQGALECPRPGVVSGLHILVARLELIGASNRLQAVGGC